jgi:hypothetical protein
MTRITKASLALGVAVAAATATAGPALAATPHISDGTSNTLITGIIAILIGL